MRSGGCSGRTQMPRRRRGAAAASAAAAADAEAQNKRRRTRWGAAAASAPGDRDHERGFSPRTIEAEQERLRPRPDAGRRRRPSGNTSYKLSSTVSFHNFKSQNLKLSVSNPKSKHVACVSVLSQISNGQSLGHKNKHDILKTDHIM